MSKVLFSTELNERNIKLKEDIIKIIEKNNIPNPSILEIGIGNGRGGVLLGKFAKEYYGIDIDKEYVELAKKTSSDNKFNYVVGDAIKIPFDKKFDVILYLFSWHFIKDFEKAIKEIKRLLNKSGIVIILEPTEKTEKWASPKLRKDSIEFNKEMYENKIKDIFLARNALKNQNGLNILEDRFDEESKEQIYVLKNKN